MVCCNDVEYFQNEAIMVSNNACSHFKPNIVYENIMYCFQPAGMAEEPLSSSLQTDSALSVAPAPPAVSQAIRAPQRGGDSVCPTLIPHEEAISRQSDYKRWPGVAGLRYQ